MRNQNYKITTSRATKTIEQIESLNQKIQRLSQRVSSNEQQIFYLKSTKQSRIIPGLNLTDLKTMIQENHSKRLIDQSHIEQLKLGIESLRQDLQKTVKKRQFECEIKSINFKLRDLNNEIKIQANELVYQMLEKAKKQINLTIQSPRLSKFNDQIQMKFIQLNDFTKKIELEMQKSLIRIKNIQNLLKSHQNSERNKQIQSLIKKQQNMVYRSDSVFSSIPIKFTVEERLSHQNKQFKVSQTTYLIDEEGYLLDQEQHYLLNSMGQQIRLTEKQLKMLRSISVMS